MPSLGLGRESSFSSPQQPFVKRRYDDYVVKVLFSKVEGGLRRFYIGGDRPVPLEIFADADAGPADLFGEGEPEASSSGFPGAFLASTGQRLGDWIAFIVRGADFFRDPAPFTVYEFRGEGNSFTAVNSFFVPQYDPGSEAVFPSYIWNRLYFVESYSPEDGSFLATIAANPNLVPPSADRDFRQTFGLEGASSAGGNFWKRRIYIYGSDLGLEILGLGGISPTIGWLNNAANPYWPYSEWENSFLKLNSTLICRAIGVKANNTLEDNGELFKAPVYALGIEPEQFGIIHNICPHPPY